MSENTINGALRRLGYSKRRIDRAWIPCHGVNLASMSKGGHPDVIELQLAHAERNKVRAAYNRATRLTERRKDDAGVGC